MNTAQVKIGVLRTGIICALVFLPALFTCCLIWQIGPKTNPQKDFEFGEGHKSNTIIQYTGKSPNVVIPGGIAEIEKEAFWGRGLTSVVIPDNVRFINSLAFGDNYLASVTLPNNRETVIGHRAFANNNLSSVTVPKMLWKIEPFAFAGNPIREVIIEDDYLYTWYLGDPSSDYQVPPNVYVFHPELPDFLPKGTYTLGDDGWVVEKPNGAVTSVHSYITEFGEDSPDVLATLLVDAIRRRDVVMVRNCVSWGVDVRKWRDTPYDTYMRNTFLARAFYLSFSPSYSREPYGSSNAEIIKILLEAGAVAQYWMLSLTYFKPDITRALLEHGALTNRESTEYGYPPNYYTRPASLLIHYILRTGSRNADHIIAESVALLLEYGVEAKYMDPNTGETPLSLALHWSHYSPEFTDLLLKHISRPLSLEEYRLIIRLNREVVYRSVWGDEVDKEHEDKWGYDALVLQDIRSGLLNPASKDKDGRDIFDYAAATGTAGLMQGLMPYLAESGRTILAPDRTGLYVDAVNAGNLATAAILSTAMSHVFTATDAAGRGYSLEFYNYDREAIYHRAQEISQHSLYQTGPGGTRLVNGSGEDVLFWPNTFYVVDRYNLLLHTAGGLRLNLGEIINGELERYYLEKGGEQSGKNNPDWHIARMFGNVLFASTSYWNNPEYALINIATGTPSVYILEKESLETTSNIGRYLLENAMDFVIESGMGYLIKSTGEVFQFTVGVGAHGASAHRARSFTFDTTVSWRDCRILGWKNGERVFVDGETVVAYNFATGAVRPLGRKAEIATGNGNYRYEDREGRRFIVEAKSAKAYPEPTEEFETFAFHENGYVYADKDYYFSTVCFFEGGILKRKLVLSGSAIRYRTINAYGNKIYIGGTIAFTIDISTAQVSAAFKAGHYLVSNNVMYIFPFGPDDVVYAYTVSDH